MIISIAGEKGGTGKTTVATNLSVFYDDLLVVDTDNQATFSKWATVRSKNKELKKVNVIQSHMENMEGGLLKDALFDLRRKYKNILVDSMGRDSAELRVLLVMSDIIIFPVKANQFDAWTVRRLDSLVGDTQLMGGNLKSFFLLSQVPTNTKVDAKETAKELNEEIEHSTLLETWLFDRKSYREGAKKGMSVIELGKGNKTTERGHSKASSEILRLSEEINEY